MMEVVFDKQEVSTHLLALQKAQDVTPEKLHLINNPVAEHVGMFYVVECDKTSFRGVILDVDVKK